MSEPELVLCTLRNGETLSIDLLGLNTGDALCVSFTKAVSQPAGMAAYIPFSHVWVESQSFCKNADHPYMAHLFGAVPGHPAAARMTEHPLAFMRAALSCLYPDGSGEPYTDAFETHGGFDWGDNFVGPYSAAQTETFINRISQFNAAVFARVQTRRVDTRPLSRSIVAFINSRTTETELREMRRSTLWTRGSRDLD